MDKEIEAFRNEVLRWRGTRRRGARPYTSAMRAKALELTAGLRNRGLTMEAATRQLGFSAGTLYAPRVWCLSFTGASLERRWTCPVIAVGRGGGWPPVCGA